MRRGKRYFIAAEIPCTVESEDAISHAVFSLGAMGCEVREHMIIAYFPDQPLESLQQKVAAILQTIRSSGLEVPNRAPVFRRFAEENWQESWKAYFKPVVLADYLAVRPPWERKPQEARVEVIIEPARAFGTGTHESTQLILEWMVAYRHDLPKHALDVGTGSGILAIAHVKLAPGSVVVGCDIDPLALENASENVRLNRVEEACWFYAGSLDALGGTTFPLIYANLESRIIAPLLEQLASHLDEGGQLLLSGILTREQEAMLRAVEQSGQLAVVAQRQKREWLLLVCRRQHADRRS